MCLPHPGILNAAPERFALEKGFQHPLNITGDKRYQFNPCGLQHIGRSFGNRPADEKHDFLGLQHLQQFQGAVRIKG